jgi:hypothetical protein
MRVLGAGIPRGRKCWGLVFRKVWTCEKFGCGIFEKNGGSKRRVAYRL